MLFIGMDSKLKILIVGTRHLKVLLIGCPERVCTLDRNHCSKLTGKHEIVSDSVADLGYLAMEQPDTRTKTDIPVPK